MTGSFQVGDYENRIQPDDVLDINVTSQNPEAAAPFNQQILYSTMQAAQSGQSDSFKKQNYLVDKQGNIEFPILGTTKVSGMSREEFIAMMKKNLKPFVSDAVVYMNIINFKISVLGEVSRPGVVVVNGDRISLLEAIAQSGDLTMFGKRKNVLIVRDEMGVKSFNRIDMTQADFINSPFYYLKQNDVVYVEPRKVKIDSTTFGTNINTTVSILGFVLAATILLTRL